MAGLIAKFILGRCCCPSVLVVDNTLKIVILLLSKVANVIAILFVVDGKNHLISCKFCVG